MAEASRVWREVPVSLPPPGGSETFVLGDLELLLCNAGGEPFVIDEVCPHAWQSMRGGRIEGTVIECPLHGGRLDLRDGQPVEMPIRSATGWYPVRREGERLQVGLPA